MDDDNKAAEQETVAADDLGVTTVAPPPTEAAPELAWSLDDEGDTAPVERQSWGLAWAQAAVFVLIGAVFAFVIGAVGWVLARAHYDSPPVPRVAQRAAEVTQTTRPEAPAVVAPSMVTVEATPPPVTVTTSPPTVTVKATPPTVTVRETPPTVTVPTSAVGRHISG